MDYEGSARVCVRQRESVCVCMCECACVHVRKESEGEGMGVLRRAEGGGQERGAGARVFGAPSGGPGGGWKA